MIFTLAYAVEHFFESVEFKLLLYLQSTAKSNSIINHAVELCTVDNLTK